MTDKYGWCHTAQCVAEWAWGQNANNLFTLLGALATFAAAFLALRFSQAEARRRMADDDARARIAAAANIARVREARDSVLDIERHCKEAAGKEGPIGILRVVFTLMARSEVIPRVGPDTLLLLAPLPNGAAVRLSRAFGTLELLERQRPLMQGYLTPTRSAEAAEFVAPLWADLQAAASDLKAATAALEDVNSADFSVR